MIWLLEFTSAASREIKKLDPSVRRQLETDLEHLASNPLQGEFLHGPLRGTRSWRTGDYRILYGVHPLEQRLTIYRVAHRREIYR